MTSVRRALTVLAGLTFAALPQVAEGQQTCAPRAVARIESIKNTVQLVQVSTRASVPATRDGQVCAGDTIQVGDNSRAVVLMLGSNTPLVIDQNSAFVVIEAPTGGGTVIDLVRGALLFITRIRRSIEIRTPFVNAAIEGTEFVVRVQDDRTVITVFEGIVRATNAAGMVNVGAGQQAVALKGQAPQIQVVVRPRDAVQWALYYDQVLPAASFAELEAIPAATRDASFYVRRAGLLLGAGQLDEARADLDQAQKLDPANGDADALRAIVAVALNDKEGALTSGRTAVERAPQSAAAQLALSYALQANFQLEAARDTATRATEIAPNDGATWARLAELRLMLDDAGGAVDAARRAAMLAPLVARAQSALGFALLAQLKLADARAAFESAVDGEPDDPLARLGLGLAKIRHGQLAEGRADIELAVALNPNDALLRSSLGKAYFDEKREALPAEQFALAKAIDPLDPTPHYYDAIHKHALNRPVEALVDLQRAISLNEARGVYRSRELLNEDMAARTAALGQIYRDLGFEQRALLEGWRSLAADSGDYSGHRFLADMYSALPRHEVARVSELLQAQLFQPLSVTHISPSLAETDLVLLEGAGPSSPSLNEFNPLFRRNRLAAQVNGLLGGRDLLADEAIVSGLWNQLAFSVGQFHYQTDGVRRNNDQNRDFGNVFVQAQLSPSTMVHGEVRTEHSRFGDLSVRFDPTVFSPNTRQRISGTTGRLGLRHDFTPQSRVVASVAVQSRDFDISDEDTDLELGITAKTTNHDTTSSVTAEARALYHRNRLSVDYGGGFFHSERRRTVVAQFEFLDGFPGYGSVEQFDDEPRQANGYLYSQLSLPSNVALTLGASAEHFQTTLFERNQFNPKVGASWTPAPSTTIRVAAFRTLTRAVVSRQTIEPTHVAGFNQFFDDKEGAASWRYGAAIDSRLGNHSLAGAEYSWRDLTIPVEIVGPTGRLVRFAPRAEQFGRAYIYFTPSNAIAAGIEYLAERDAARLGSERLRSGQLSLRSHHVPLTVNIFSSAGVFGRVRADFVRQRAQFLAGLLPTSGEDSFWVVSGRLGYRLPNRYGLVVLDVANLFDEQDFNYEATDPGRPDLTRGRVATVRFELSL